MPRRLALTHCISRMIPPATRAPQVFTIMEVEYFLDWKRLIPGASFFIPTIATPKQVQEVLEVAYEHLPYNFVVYTRREYGRYGVRVWCLN